MAPYAQLDIQTYFGGKGASGVYQQIINQIPPHHTFVSGFLGHCAVMRMKRPARHNIGIDLDEKVVQAWEQGTFAPGLNPTIIHGSFLQLSASGIALDEEDTYCYLDPPYLINTRSSQRDRYNCELSYMEHELLLHKALSLKCMVAISHYPNGLYDELLKEWRTIDFQARTRGYTATERLYMNYAPPQELHDYSYLGNDYKQREKIKLKFERWKASFERLPVLEQNMRIHYLNKKQL